MAERLTDEKRKMIVVDYAESGSYKATAKRFGVADNTVRRICRNESEMSRKVAQKRAENTADMISFMESRKCKAQGVIDNCLNILPEKLERASAAQVATVMGIMIDKFTRQTDAGMDIPKILENMDVMADIVMHPVPNRDITDYEK